MRYFELAGTIALVILTFGARQVEAQPRTCVRATVEEPFVLPDGSRHPAGLLRICLDRDYSPVSGLHTIVSEDRGPGWFLSRRNRVEGEDAASPRMAFVRDSSGALRLRGYTLARGHRVEAYWIEPPRGVHVAAAPAPADQTLWVAAVVVP